MSTDTEKLEEAAKSFSFKAAIAVTAFMALVGIYIYLIKGLAYLDVWMLPYAALYIGAAVGMFFVIRTFNPALLGVCIVLAVLALTLSLTKIGWAKAYYENPEPFTFDAYIDKYPSWEEHILSPLLGKPDWVGFEKDCARPVLNKKEPGANCTTMAAIQNQYRIDSKKALDDYIARMRHTVSMVNKRGSMNAAQYKNCILSKECAEIPILPEGAPDTIKPDDQNFARVSKAFWDLAEAKPLSPEVCDYSILCRVLVATGAVKFE